jgi:hypothetical protein
MLQDNKLRNKIWDGEYEVLGHVSSGPEPGHFFSQNLLFEGLFQASKASFVCLI